MDSDHNLFSGNVRSIIAEGSTHPLVVDISNCLFDQIPEVAIEFSGENAYLAYNNTFQQTGTGIISRSTGDHFNYIKCNIYDDLINSDNIIAFNNQNTEFNENISQGLTPFNYAILGATIKNNIGIPTNPAANCFSEDAIDILAMPLLGIPELFSTIIITIVILRIARNQ